MSGVPGIAYNPFIDEEARDAYFDIEQAVDLPSVERVEKTETLTFEQSRQGQGVFFGGESGRTPFSETEATVEL